MPNSDTMIDIRGVSKNFGSVRAVDNVSIQIGRGEFFSLLGASGCGKTTLLRMLAGFEMPDSGEIFIDGQPMSDLPANRRPTNMVFQSYALFPHLNVRDNIAYGLINRRLSRAETDRIVDQALHMIKLSGYGNRKAHELSGGQRQRIALARALVCQPKVLLLDEPLGALDKKLREEMQLELRQIQKSVEVTFVFVTHDQEEALNMSDRIAVMSGGHVLQVDSAVNLYEFPNSREVANFIGAMNFLDGKLVDQDANIAIVEVPSLGRFSVRKDQPSPVPSGAATIAIRPEKISLAAAAPSPSMSTNILRGRLATQAYLGDRRYMFIEAPGLDRPLAVSIQNIRRSGEEIVAAASDLFATWPIESGVLLTR